jgi:electron transport complex protein RnfD
MLIGKTIGGIMYHKLCALIPAAIAAVYYFRADALRVMIIASVTALVCEYGMQKFLKREITIWDGSALLSGLLLSFLLPATTVWWVVAVGAAISIILGKQIFGGLGNNPFNDVLVGWVILRMSWPERISDWAMPFGAEIPDPPLHIFKIDGLEAFQDYYFEYIDLFLGKQGGGLGAVCIAALLAGGIFLLLRRMIKWQIPVGLLVSVFIFSGILWLIDSEVYLNPVFHLISGSTVLGAFFLATDPATSPVTRWGKLTYGIVAGSLIMVIRTWGKFPDAVAFAILLANAGVPLFNKIKSRPYGKEKGSA